MDRLSWLLERVEAIQNMDFIGEDYECMDEDWNMAVNKYGIQTSKTPRAADGKIIGFKSSYAAAMKDARRLRKNKDKNNLRRVKVIVRSDRFAKKYKEAGKKAGEELKSRRRYTTKVANRHVSYDDKGHKFVGSKGEAMKLNKSEAGSARRSLRRYYGGKRRVKMVPTKSTSIKNLKRRGIGDRKI